MTKLGIVVPTRNRPNELGRLLKNLSEQSRVPDAVVVVDSSDREFDCKSIVLGLANLLPLRYIRHAPPSAAAQRNAGIETLVGEVDLIGLIDDDVVLDGDALKNACAAIFDLSDNIVGFALNRTDHEAAQKIGYLRGSRIIAATGLYSPRMGVVSPSGWHTRISTVEKDTVVEWIATGAAIWRASALKDLRFDEFFEEYSYMEDLDLSLQARALGGLVVLAEAKYGHHAALGGRKSRFWFGRIEVRNRYYIVRKHGLSKSRFLVGMLLRMGLTVADIGRGHWCEVMRLLGNIAELPCMHRRLTSFRARQ